MLRPQSLLPDGQCPPVKRLCLGIPPLNLEQEPEVINGRCHFWVLCPGVLFEDLQRAPVERFRLGVPTLGLVGRALIGVQDR